MEGRVDIITGTLGKALGGASGGYTSGRREIIDLLRQRSRPYLFSNYPGPSDRQAPALELFDMLEESTELRDHLEEATAYYRKASLVGQRIRYHPRNPSLRAGYAVR
ncbi:MAG: aminotransferase class I/II-fold pyridoxal phosphate-dependent enzyme [[Clostridium] scindens]